MNRAYTASDPSEDVYMALVEKGKEMSDDPIPSTSLKH